MSKIVLGAKIENPFGLFGHATDRPSGTPFVIHEGEQYPVESRQIVHVSDGKKWLPHSFDNGGSIHGPAEIVLGKRQLHEEFMQVAHHAARRMKTLALLGLILPTVAGAGWLGQEVSGDPLNSFTALCALWGAIVLFGQWVDTGETNRRALSRHYQKHGHYTLPMHAEPTPTYQGRRHDATPRLTEGVGGLIEAH